MSLTLQFFAMFCLLYLVTDYENFATKFDLLMGFPASSQAHFLLIMWTVLCFVLVLSSVLAYAGKASAVKLARLYEEAAISRTLTKIIRAKAKGKQINSPLIKTFLARGPHYLGRLSLEIHSSVVPVLTCCVAFLIMLLANWKISLLIIFLLLALVPAFIVVNRHATLSTKRMNELAARHSAAKADLLRALEQHGTDAVVKEFGLGVEQRFLDNYEIRLRATFKSVAITNTIAAFAFFFALIPFLHQIDGEGGSAAGFAIFFVSLVYFFRGLQQFYRLATKFYIFYPHMKPYFTYEMIL